MVVLRRYVKDFIFSRHYCEDKDIDTGLAVDCIHTGRKKLEQEPNKFKARKKYRTGELITIYKEFDEYFLVITAFWNKRGDEKWQ